MQTIQIIIELLSKRGVSPSKMCRDLNFSSGLFSQWKQGKQNPSIEKLNKIADYLGTTVDYLLCNEQKNKPAAESDELTDMEKRVIEVFRLIPPESRDLVVGMIETALRSQGLLK